MHQFWKAWRGGVGSHCKGQGWQVGWEFMIFFGWFYSLQEKPVWKVKSSLISPGLDCIFASQIWYSTKILHHANCVVGSPCVARLRGTPYTAPTLGLSILGMACSYSFTPGALTGDLAWAIAMLSLNALFFVGFGAVVECWGPASGCPKTFSKRGE